MHACTRALISPCHMSSVGPWASCGRAGLEACISMHACVRAAQGPKQAHAQAFAHAETSVLCVWLAGTAGTSALTGPCPYGRAVRGWDTTASQPGPCAVHIHACCGCSISHLTCKCASCSLSRLRRTRGARVPRQCVRGSRPLELAASHTSFLPQAGRHTKRAQARTQTRQSLQAYFI